MNIFALDGIGLLLTLAMSLLVSGVIMFYCLRRFKMLENSIVEQGKVLQSFILKNQNQLEQQIASPIALESALVQNNDRIEVSDDSEYEDEDESDNDSQDDEDSDDNSDTDNKDDNPSLEIEDDKIKEIEGEELRDTIEKNIIENLDEKVGLKIVEVDSPIEDITDLDDKESKKPTGLTKLKVNELKDIAIEKNLDSTDNINKLKKEQLIKLINEN